MSAGENVFPVFIGEDDLKFDVNWQKRYSWRINTRNTSLAGVYKCQHSDARRDIVHNVAVLRLVGQGKNFENGIST